MSESGHQDRQQGEAQRVRSDEGETLQRWSSVIVNIFIPLKKINRRFKWRFYPVKACAPTRVWGEHVWRVGPAAERRAAGVTVVFVAFVRLPSP